MKATHSQPNESHGLRPASRPGIIHWLSRLAALTIAALALLGSGATQAAVLSWSGASPTTSKWSDSSNWGGAGVPANGDTLIFSAGQPRQINTNDLANLTLAQIRFILAGGGYVISGNAFTLTNGIVATNTVGANTISNAITLATIDQPVTVGTGASLTLSGVLSGSVGVTKTGAGTLTYACTGNNLYSGTTRVNAGTLQLNVSGTSAFGGSLIIGDGVNASWVLHLRNNEIADTAAITINANGTLDVNGFIETISSSLTLNGGAAQSGAGTLTLSASSTITVSGTSYIYDNLNLGSGTCTIQGSGYLYLSANVGGSANIVKNGTVSLLFYGNNTFTGTLTANTSGYLWLTTDTVLGGTNGGTILNDATYLYLYGALDITNEPLTLNTTHTPAIYAYGYTNSWSATNFTLAANAVIEVATNGILNLIGPIGGAGGLTKTDTGTLTFSGGAANAYAGTTTVSGGTLLLGQTTSGGAIPGTLVIGTNCTVRNLQNWQLNSPYKPVTIRESGLLDLAGHSEWLGALTLQGAQITTGSGLLYLGGDILVYGSSVATSLITGNATLWNGTKTITCTNHFWSPDFEISANLGGNAASGIIKNGAGEMSLSGTTNTFPGSVTVNAGNLRAQTATAFGNTNTPATVNSGGSIFLDGSVAIGLKPLSLSGPGSFWGALFAGFGNSSWAGDVTLATNSIVGVYNASSLTLSGAIGGPGSLTKTNLGTLSMTGSTSNSYAGTTIVSGGTLLLGKSIAGYAIPSSLVASNSSTVRLANSFQINSPGKSITLNPNSLFDLAGNSEWIGPVTIQGSQITSGAGTLYLGGDIGVVPDPVISQISGNLSLYGTNRTIANTVYSYGLYPHNWDLNISASISSYTPGLGLIKTGVGAVALTAANTYSGPTYIQQGWLWASNALALGATSRGTEVSSGATLVLAGNTSITNEALTLNGPGAIPNGWGALDAEGTTNTWAGPITNNANSTLDAWAAGAALHILGPISGPGGLELFGGGTHYFEGPATNTYVGITKVDSGTTLVLAKSTTAVPGALDISGTAKLAGDSETAGFSDVTIQASGRLETGGYTDYINALNGSGQLSLGGGGWLLIGNNNGSSVFSGVISGAGNLYKYGSGTITLSGTNTYTGTTHAQNGTLLINGYQPQSPVDFYFSTTSTLGGIGVVGPIYATGLVQPGASPGCLTSSNLTFTSTGTYHVELNGLTSCSGYDQMIVRGTNNLANATLNVSTGFTTPVPIGQQFVIINNDGVDPIAGTFAGLPNGAMFSVGGIGFRINYNGGDGNDVVLTVVSAPGGSVTLNAADTGWYDNTGLHTPINPNYLAGDYGTNILRNWFVFNVPAFTGSVAKAELLINCYNNVSPYDHETYVLRQVSTPIGTLTAGGSGLTNIYNDLADGPVYADRKMYAAESGERAIIPLNVTFINDLAAAMGGQIALGGSVATLDGIPGNQYLFWHSAWATNDVQLRLTFGTTTLVNATADGWYNNTGAHTGGNTNYFVGEDLGYAYRNFFVFGLPAMSARPVGAELLLKPYNIFSLTNWVVYQVHDVATTINTLTNSATNATSIFADLGDGNLFGGRELYTNEVNLGVNSSIPLNGAFTAAAFANSGGQIALGGALTLDPAPDNEGAFGHSIGNAGEIQLWLSFIPSAFPTASFLPGSPTALGGNAYKLTLAGTTGTTNEIQASMDFVNWDAVRTLYMTNTTTTFSYTNAAFPYRFFRARLLQ